MMEAMMRKLSILLFILLSAYGATAKPLRDGAIFAGADGTLAKDPNADRWLFVLKTTVADDKGAIQEGQAIEMLRSSTLEKMLSIIPPKKTIFVCGVA
jgi:hypothetical protein